jgi:hypothetical protein
MTMFRYQFPLEPENTTCVMLLIPSHLVPIVGSLFGSLELRAKWLTEDDWEQGYKAFTALEAQLMNSCLQDLIQEIRDLRGVLPDFVETPIEERTSDMYNSLNNVRTEIFDTRGILVDGWFTDTTASMADIVRAMRGSDQETGSSLWSTIAGLLAAGASLASIVDFITDLLTSQEEVVVEGGLGIAQVALLAGIAGVLQSIALTQNTQTAALLAILTAMKGDGEITDNILLALRGTTPASATHNLATLLGEDEV